LSDDAALDLPEQQPLRGQLRLLIPVLTVVFVAALDLTVVAPILPRVISDLNINTVDADRYSWIVLSYLVAYTVTVPLTGRVSDFVGRMPVFAGALALFMAGSVVAAGAHTLGPMIVGRTLQGLGGGAMLPVSMALVADVVPRNRRAAALGMVAAVDTFGWVLGPVWGAAIDGLFGNWRAIFWLNLPLGAGAAVLLWFAHARGRPRSNSSRPNLLNALVAAGLLVAFSLALSSGGEAGLSSEQGTGRLGASTNPLSSYRWPLLALAALLLGAVVLLERRSTNPLLPRRLLNSTIFRVAGLANLLVGAALIVAMVNAPLAVALLVVEDKVPFDSAALLGSFTLAMTAGALLGGRLMERFTPRAIAAVGLALALVGFTLMHWWPDQFKLASMALTMALAGVGLGVVIAPIGETAIRAAGRDSYGAASGLVLLARLLGMTIGLSGMTAYSLARLDSKVAALPPVPIIPDESASAYFQRQQDYLNDQVIPLTLQVIRETFLLAALVCVVAVVVVLFMRTRVAVEADETA
jgi:MFS family permease